MRALVTAVLLVASSQLSACGSSVFGCTDVLVSAVSVTVVNSRGEAQKDARVMFSHDGGSMKEAECFSPDANGGCDSWAIFEDTGDYLVRATSADGSRSAQAEVEVDGDGCHPISEQLKLTLPD
jgi:hypothetical protein